MISLNLRRHHAVTRFRLLKSSGLVSFRALSIANTPFFEISNEIRDAVQSGRPVVALETTIYTHGFPYPENISLSSRLESIVRANGAVPATIGCLRGVAKVGLNLGEIEELLATAGSTETIKLSRRDLGYICGLGVNGRKLNGGTTIAGTMVLSHLAGISVFATGGLGGVHIGGENTMDVSADLTELGRTPVAVVSSGCKSFLDVPRTLEYLETQGVGVATFADGRLGSVDFPAFWTRDSGIPSPTVIKDEKEAAAIIYVQKHLQMSSGQIFANPISGDHSLPKDAMDIVIARVVDEAERRTVSGSDSTPYILKRISEITEGATIHANRALVEANVDRGAKIAVELAKLELEGRAQYIGNFRESSGYVPSRRNVDEATRTKAANVENTADANEEADSEIATILVSGSIAVDLSCDYKPNVCTPEVIPVLQTSNRAIITESLGGVAQNVATAAHYLGISVRLCTAVGDDAAGDSAIRMLRSRGMKTDGIEVLSDGSRTAQYVAINDTNKGLFVAMADMGIFDAKGQDFKGIWQPHLDRHKPKWLVVDANWDTATLQSWILSGRAQGARVVYEPVSVEKSTRILDQSQELMNASKLADLVTPNEMELIAMSSFLQERFTASNEHMYSIPSQFLAWFGHSTPEVDYGKLFRHSLRLLSCFPSVLTKLGSEGILLTELIGPEDPRLNLTDVKPYIFYIGNPGHASGSATPFLSSHKASGAIYFRHFPSVRKVLAQEIVSVNGVGDTFLGVIIAGLAMKNPKPLHELVDIAQKGAVMTLMSNESVSPEVFTLRPLLGI